MKSKGYKRESGGGRESQRGEKVGKLSLLLCQLWMGVVLVLFFFIRVLGSNTAHRLWRVH